MVVETKAVPVIERRRPTWPSTDARSELRGALVFADGTVFEGKGIGTRGVVQGEFVFTTSMTGYEEALTDPSYRGQILMFTYPLIGNYGVAHARRQSSEIHPRAIVVSTLSPTWEGKSSLRDLLRTRHVPVLHDFDTRSVARHIRTHGAMPAAVVMMGDGDAPDAARIARSLDLTAYDTADFVSEVTVPEPRWYGKGNRTVALLDCGNKRSVIDELLLRNCRVRVLPATTPAAEVLRLRPDGVIISNGPGNPEAAQHVITTVRTLYQQVPLFGICLGHQILALAVGARTFKLPFGHRGANHPVQDVVTGRAFITTQNHGYAVDPSSLPDELVESHSNLNDGTVEGLRHRSLPIRSLQFHPEGAPGPRDAGVVLDEWLEEIA